MLDTLAELARRFYEGLGATVESIALSPEDEEKRIYCLSLRSPDSNLLIGQRGKNLEASAHLLSRMMERSLGASVRLHIEINDYVHSRDERLFRFVDRKIEYVLSRRQDATIENLSAYERKKVHDYIAEKSIATIATYSIGEGNERKLCISYADKPRAIEEDGVGI
jgi:spoIIIJ-associated protein